MFLPLGDTPNPRNFTPWVNWALIAANVGVYVLITLPLSQTPVDPTDPLLREYLRAIAPNLPPLTSLRQVLVHLSAYDLFTFAHGYKPGAPEVGDLFACMFLHGGFLHLAGNMLFLWIFGDNVEHRLGRVGYLLAYLATGVLATLSFSLFETGSMTPLVGAWLAFGFLYTFMPNTRVRFVPAVVSSLAGALLWTLWQKTYISLQIGVARYNAIYGTFASVPIFLAWLYVGWVIVLLGAEVAFAVQNHATYHLEQRAESASFRARLLIAVAVAVRAVEAMREGSEAFEAAEFARRGKIPVRLVNEVVGVLSRAGWIVEVADQPGSYVLRRDPDSLDLRDIVELILDDGASPEQLGLLRAEGGLARVAEAIDRGIEEGVPGLTMGELVRDVHEGEENAGGGGSDV